MRRTAVPLACLALALGALTLPARAANPKVTLQVERATAAEVLQRLGQAAGVPLETQGELPRVMELATFEWHDVPFGAALRQVSERFRLLPQKGPDGSGYVLRPWPGAPAGPAPRRVGLCERGGVRLYATQVSMEERRTKNFVNNDVAPEDSRVQLRLFCELGEGDAEAMMGVENVTARDDLGKRLTFAGATPVYTYNEPQYPDQWQTNLSFSLPNPKARKLVSVDGELMAYQMVRPLRLEIPLPLSAKSVRKRVGDWLVVLSQYQASRPEAPDDDNNGLPELVARTPSQGPVVRMRVYHPYKSNVTPRGGNWFYPTVVGASGRTYSAVPNDGRGAGNGQMLLTDVWLSMPTPGDMPAKLVWNLVEKAEPIRLTTFHMEDIPLPDAPVLLPPKQAPKPAGPAPTPTDLEHPFYQRDGGILVNRLELPEMAPTHGRMEVGLQDKRGAVWGPIRWAEVDQAGEGLYRLGPLKPGVYRLHRAYRPTGAAGSLAGGQWLNAEVTITLAAGKETTPPPLKWARATPAGKPAAKK